jgi:hypothetical protein
MNDSNYLDELVLYEHGKYNITKYKEWVTEWDSWLNGTIPCVKLDTKEPVATDKIVLRETQENNEVVNQGT